MSRLLFHEFMCIVFRFLNVFLNLVCSHSGEKSFGLSPTCQTWRQANCGNSQQDHPPNNEPFHFDYIACAFIHVDTISIVFAVFAHPAWDHGSRDIFFSILAHKSALIQCLPQVVGYI